MEKKQNFAVLRTPSPVDEFIYEHGVDNNGKDITFVQNDIYMLFNQERLQKLGIDMVNNWIQSLVPSPDSSLDKLRSNLSDDELLSLVKSRHIQAPSELLNYSKWLDQNADEFTKAVQEVQKARISDSAQVVENVESKVE